MTTLERTDPVNWSSLKHILNSPRHYIHELTRERTPPTEAQLLGSVAHCAIYEPDEVENRYAVMPNFHGGMKDDTARAKGYDGGKGAKEEWLATHTTHTPVTQDIWERAHRAAAAVMADPIAGPMIESGRSEYDIEWIDEETGIACRGRVDHVNGRLSDLKTTRSVFVHDFTRDVAKYLYHCQLAWYANGLSLNGIDPGKPAIVAVESKEPFDVVVFEMSADTITTGRREYRRALDLLAVCRATDTWPGVGNGHPTSLELPAWAQNGTEPKLTMGGKPLNI